MGILLLIYNTVNVLHIVCVTQDNSSLLSVAQASQLGVTHRHCAGHT